MGHAGLGGEQHSGLGFPFLYLCCWRCKTCSFEALLCLWRRRQKREPSGWSRVAPSPFPKPIKAEQTGPERPRSRSLATGIFRRPRLRLACSTTPHFPFIYFFFCREARQMSFLTLQTEG